jgi:predicted 3-demethylubiquinone-9 3-methyltransferase (glyoxalase superfamily)
MNNSIHPCLWFDGQAKEAATFYCSIFSAGPGGPNSKITTDTPMVVNFELMGKKFMGLNGGPMFTINPSISIFVYCKTAEQTDEIYNRLAEGGEPLMAIGKYDWSERYGWIKDKYGLTWQVMLSAEERILPCLLFTGEKFGKAEEAINFYTSVFSAGSGGDNSAVDAMHHYPNETPFAGKVLFSEFKLNQYSLTAMDGPGEHAYTFNEAVSFVVDCETQEEIDYYWNKLTDGGEESMCGWLKDKFGVSWQIVPTILGQLMSDAEKAPRVMQAFMQMKKFDIEKLKQA